MIAYWIILAMNVFLMFLVRMMTDTYSDDQDTSSHVNTVWITYGLGWPMLAILIFMIYVAAVRYFDSLEDRVSKMLYPQAIPSFALASMLLALGLEISKVRNAYYSTHSLPGNSDLSMLYYNPYILLFSAAFAVAGGWATVKKRSF